jgi:hypothetical protein
MTNDHRVLYELARLFADPLPVRFSRRVDIQSMTSAPGRTPRITNNP